MCVNKTALIASEEKGSLSLLNGLAESTGGEVNFTAESLGLVVTEELLEHRSATKGACQNLLTIRAL